MGLKECDCLNKSAIYPFHLKEILKTQLNPKIKLSFRILITVMESKVLRQITEGFYLHFFRANTPYNSYGGSNENIKL